MQLALKCCSILAIVGMSLALVSCDNSIFRGPAAIRLVDGAPVIAVCANIRVVEAFATARGAGGRFWEAAGDIDLISGTTISLAAPPDGLFNSMFVQPPFEPGSKFMVTLVAPEVPGINGDIYAEFEVPAEGLPSSDWLGTDGLVRDEACV